MIKNKLKIGLFVMVLSLAMFGGVSSADAAALTWSANQTVDLSDPDVNLTIVSGSEATSLVVKTGGVDVVVPNGDAFTVTSANRDLIVSGVTTSQAVQSCSAASLKTVAIYGATSGETITLSASSSECTPDSSGGGGGGGGGGGSSKPVTPATPATPATPGTGCAPGNLFSSTTGQACPTSSTPVGCGGGNLFSGVTGQMCPVVSAPPYTPPSAPGASAGAPYAFGTTLVKQGTKGEACKAWQMFLNAKSNAGLITDGICGPLTIGVAKAWQATNGLVADGLLGSLSRARARTQ